MNKNGERNEGRKRVKCCWCLQQREDEEIREIEEGGLDELKPPTLILHSLLLQGKFF